MEKFFRKEQRNQLKFCFRVLHIHIETLCVFVFEFAFEKLVAMLLYSMQFETIFSKFIFFVLILYIIPIL